MNSRRDFLRTAAAAAVGTGVAARTIHGAHAAGSDAIRVGVVGFGGRGAGAVENALQAAEGVTLVAAGDVFKDRLEASLKRIKEGKYGAKVDVPADRQFVGFDAFEKVIATDANYIILATPPGFRPAHLKAAIAAGKHVFTEKPVAVDGPGIRDVLKLADEAKAKGLGVGAGTQRRHQTGYLEIMKRVKDGAIGDIVAARAYWNQGLLWKRDREPSWTDMEWQLRNWLYFTWLSGDHIVEQHIHNLDVVNWAKGTHPVRAMGMGGRQVRTGPEWGHIFDHHAIDYEYADGTHMLSMCRQINGCANSVSEALVGSAGRVATSDKQIYQIEGKKPFSFDPKKDNAPYTQEHVDLIASIRAGKPLNELKAVAESTLTAIMGRMSTYTGKVVTWEQALNSNEQWAPATLAFGPLPTPPVPKPGVTPLT